jgi:hypothetical protein
MMQEIRRDAYVTKFRDFYFFPARDSGVLKKIRTGRMKRRAVELIKVMPFCITLFLLEQTAADSNCGSIYKKLLVSAN